MLHRLTRRQLAYLDFLSGRKRPASFDGVTTGVVRPLYRLGLIEPLPSRLNGGLAPGSAPLAFFWKLTERGEAVARSVARPD